MKRNYIIVAGVPATYVGRADIVDFDFINECEDSYPAEVFKSIDGDIVAFEYLSERIVNNKELRQDADGNICIFKLGNRFYDIRRGLTWRKRKRGSHSNSNNKKRNRGL